MLSSPFQLPGLATCVMHVASATTTLTVSTRATASTSIAKDSIFES